VKNTVAISSHLCLPVASPDRGSPSCPGELAFVQIPHSATTHTESPDGSVFVVPVCVEEDRGNPSSSSEEM
jgi:hypothetical protein